MHRPVCTLLLLSASTIWAQQSSQTPEPKLEPGTGLVYSVPAGKNPADKDAPTLKECPATFPDGVQVLQEIPPGVVAPKAVKTQPAKFPKEARAQMKKEGKPLEAVSLISLVVNEEGRPEHICLKKAAGYGLDLEAAKAISRYTWEPATKEGTPFPSRIFVEVGFKAE